jgi:hypothetical protein
MKVLILNYNRLTLPVAMADWAAARGCEPVFIDNASDYPPLLEFYAAGRYPAVRLDKNYGHTVLWDKPELFKLLGINERFIMTDPDLALEGVPDDFLAVLNEGLDRFPQVDKCALSLAIEDLPATPEGIFIRNHEAKHWRQPLDSRYFYADTDTTFALYRWPLGKYSHSAVRTNRPYTCRHVPWYYPNLFDIPADEQYYFRTANESSSGKKRLASYGR